MFLLNNLAPPPTPDNAAISSLYYLLAIVSDPNAAKETLTKIASALSEANAAIEAAKNAEAALQAARDEQAQTLKRERAEHDRDLAEQKARCDSECARAMDEIRSQRASANQLQGQAQADAAVAASLKADLQRRLDAIRTAVA